MPRVLSIAGTDPSGGAGIQADLKSIAATGGYGMAAVTALVAQNTHGVRSVHTPPADFLRQQLEAVSDDVVIDAVKIGMLGTAEVTQTVTGWLAEVRPPVVVLDPVMVATSGDRLLSTGAEKALRQLLHRVDLVTPNLPELAVLLHEDPAQTWDQALDQGRRLAGTYSTAVLVKGGHLTGDAAPDALVVPDGGGGFAVTEVSSVRVATKNTHGTGCSLSAAMATLFARTGNWVRTLTAAKAWLQETLETADLLDVGTGHGPVNHFHGVWERGLAPLPGPAAVPGGFLPTVGSEEPGAEGPGPVSTSAAPGGSPAPAGGWTAALWKETAGLRSRIDELDFVRGLGDGSLPQESFGFYLTQDAIYLRGYARAMARASELAPRLQEQVFWAAGARNALEAELDLHRNWLGPAGGTGVEQVLSVPAGTDVAAAGPVTRGYLEHLLARDRYAEDRIEYARLVGAVLPCFWVYAEVGARLQRLNHTAHPHREWLDTYADPGFAAATEQAVAILETVLAGDVAERRAAQEAFTGSVQWEHDFFAAGTLP
ncbi:bifunctional hydroxymethylpyrimidine kinase/phosphomethylpyrimidine kinase [Arthrobacter sp. Sa2BUA2]|uniref:Bifunctional hydroxymethylpyrimidine kinase/phosphomethylpyrimidine kinase n=1 Tax=Arthrobacter pullicola TaxID=2762224 RepID=A0ABR8YKP4_9MICC|nr:bifunctional hydroxymethylpyrimidine kinase/phosphomethylpyrimidine kinase [Arthrobacter pullicola]